MRCSTGVGKNSILWLFGVISDRSGKSKFKIFFIFSVFFLIALIDLFVFFFFARYSLGSISGIISIWLFWCVLQLLYASIIVEFCFCFIGFPMQLPAIFDLVAVQVAMGAVFPSQVCLHCYISLQASLTICTCSIQAHLPTLSFRIHKFDIQAIPGTLWPICC